MAREPRVPSPEGLNAEFYEHAVGGVLHLQRCAACQRFRHPPRQVCAGCGSGDYEWVASAGRGTLFSWTVTHFPFDRGWADDLPYITVVVELEEGVRVVGAVEDVTRDQLRRGLPLVIDVQALTDDFAFFVFHRDDA